MPSRMDVLRSHWHIGPMSKPEHVEGFVVEQAMPDDVSRIELMVKLAYSKYIERLGRMPAPMTEDYGKLVEAGGVHVLRVNGKSLGSIVLSVDGDSLKVNNLVVDPAAQGRGYGRVLMEHAEGTARAQGLAAVTLFTNEKMHENIALYTKIGFAEVDRRTENGFDRVFFRMSLS